MHSGTLYFRIVCVCMYTPGHTYTGTCVCVCLCDPLEAKFTRSYHFLNRTAHAVPEAEKRETQSCSTGGGGAGGFLPRLEPSHGRRITEPRKRAVPFHRGGRGGEGRGKHISLCLCYCVCIYIYTHTEPWGGGGGGGRGGGARRGATIYIDMCIHAHTHT